MAAQCTRLLASLVTYSNHLKDIDIRKDIRTEVRGGMDIQGLQRGNPY